MSTSDDHAQICEAIQSQIEHVLGSATCQAWRHSQRLSSGDLIILNNSFLFRQGVTDTVKNPSYLAVRLADDGERTLPAVIVKPDGKLNMRFKRIAARSAVDLPDQPIEEAVAEQLADLGSIIFALVGAIGPDRPASLALDDSVHGLTTIRFMPGQVATAEIQGSELTINRLDDIDIVWRAIKAAAPLDGQGVDTKRLADQFERLFVELREASDQPISIDDVNVESPSILSNIVERLADQVDRYKRALEQHVSRPDDTEVLNETLRIAYNFADGAASFLSLVVGLSDLKPIVLWRTFGAQSDLSDRFGELPFALAGKAKPSIGSYREVIAGARNMAFHDVFAFERPFSVPLSGDAIKRPELHLFREYSKRTAPALDYSDRRVVELLQGFTRVAQRPVPIGFWDSNANVMQAVCEVAKSLHGALTACFAAIRSPEAP